MEQRRVLRHAEAQLAHPAEELLRQIPRDAEKVVLNIKRGARPNLQPDGNPEFVRESVEKCLEMLGGRGRIDMFECARKDPEVPLEKTLGVLKDGGRGEDWRGGAV